MKRFLLFFMLLTCSVKAQWTPYGLGLIQKPNAISARSYLGVIAVTNGNGVVFTLLPGGLYSISVSAAPGSGTVTSNSAGGLSPLFTTSIANPTTTPALSFSAISQTANKVFAGPSSGGAANPTFRSLVAGDIPALSYVSSVDLSMPSGFTVSGNPITSSGTLTVTLNSESANQFFVGPASGGAATPTFRTVSIDEMNDVTITAPAAGNVLAYSGSQWTNGPSSGGGGGGTSIDLMSQQTNAVITLRTIAPDVADSTVSTFNGFGDTLAFASSGGTGAGTTKNYLTGSVIGSYAETRTAATSGAIEVLSTGAAVNAVLPYNGGSFYWQSYCVVLNTNSVRIAMGAWGSASGFDPFTSDAVVTNQTIFRYSTAAGDLTWKAVCSDGTNISVLDTGVAVQTNTAYFFQIQKTGTPAVTFTVNRTAAVSTNGATAGIPDHLNVAGDKMFVFSGLKTLATGAKTNLIRYIGYTVDWPNK